MSTPAITVTERFESRPSETGANASVDLLYTVEGTDSDLDAKAALEEEAPLSYDSLVRKSCKIEPLGPASWTGTAKYELASKNKPPKETGEKVLSFDTGGGTQHITQSIATVHKYALPGQTAPDFKGAIGVTHDSVEGCDITTPTFQFSVTCYIPAELVTPDYIGVLFSRTGKVNNAAFTVFGLGNFNEGELLFLGAQGSERGDGTDWEIQFRFAGSPNRTGITVGDITGIEKKGWEYMWIRYADAVDENTLVKHADAVYIEQVYETADFGYLDPEYEPES